MNRNKTYNWTSGIEQIAQKQIKNHYNKNKIGTNPSEIGTNPSETATYPSKIVITNKTIK